MAQYGSLLPGSLQQQDTFAGWQPQLQQQQLLSAVLSVERMPPGLVLWYTACLITVLCLLHRLHLQPSHCQTWLPTPLFSNCVVLSTGIGMQEWLLVLLAEHSCCIAGLDQALACLHSGAAPM